MSAKLRRRGATLTEYLIVTVLITLCAVVGLFKAFDFNQQLYQTVLDGICPSCDSEAAATVEKETAAADKENGAEGQDDNNVTNEDPENSSDTSSDDESWDDSSSGWESDYYDYWWDNWVSWWLP